MSLEQRPPCSGAHASPQWTREGSQGTALLFPSGGRSRLTRARLGPRPTAAVLSADQHTYTRQPPRATCFRAALSSLPPAVPRPARPGAAQRSAALPGTRRHFPSVFPACLRGESGRERRRRAERAHSNSQGRAGPSGAPIGRAYSQSRLSPPPIGSGACRVGPRRLPPRGKAAGAVEN